MSDVAGIQRSRLTHFRILTIKTNYDHRLLDDKFSKRSEHSAIRPGDCNGRTCKLVDDRDTYGGRSRHGGDWPGNDVSVDRTHVFVDADAERL